MKITQEQYDNLNTNLEDSYEEAMQEKSESGEEEFRHSFALGLYAGFLDALVLLDIDTYARTSDGCVQVEPYMVVD